MQLKLQRGQRSAGLLGKSVMFQLNARVEYAPDEAETIKKHKIGWLTLYMSHGDTSPIKTNITFDSIARGHQIECRDLVELVDVEHIIRKECEKLKDYLKIAATFDGREILVDYNDETPR